MGCRAAAVEQSGFGKKHRAGAHRTDATRPFRDRSQPAHSSRANFVLLDRVTAGDKHGVDLSADFSKRFVRVETQPAVRSQGSMRSCADHLNRINRSRAGIFPAMHGGGACENLKRSNKVENLRFRTGDEYDPPRSWREPHG